MRISASISLKPGTVPKFCKYRSVQYALREAVEEELDRLQRDGVIDKVDVSEWGTHWCVLKRKTALLGYAGITRLLGTNAYR